MLLVHETLAKELSELSALPSVTWTEVWTETSVTRNSARQNMLDLG